MNIQLAEHLTTGLFFVMFVWSIVGAVTGILSRKEFFSVAIIIDALGLVDNFLLLAIKDFHFTPWRVIAFCLWLFWLRRDIKGYKNSKDDDDHRKRRRAWLKSKLPKPVVKPLENPA